MAIKEHIGYPDHILQVSNQKLDQEYAHVSKYSLFHITVNNWKIHFKIDSSCFSFQLNFSEEHYFENTLENLKSEAQKSLKKLREPVDPDL